MPYVLNSSEQIKRMCEAVGVSSPEELYAHIPEKIRIKKETGLPGGVSEQELRRMVRAVAEKNNPLSGYSSFLGAGSYRHYLPAALQTILSRSEFYTAYTPYQPECSQGTLQAIYEFQSYICLLTGMDAANASLYDGATAAAEAVLMSLRLTGRSGVLVSRNVHPEYRKVLDTYLRGGEYEMQAVPFSKTGEVSGDHLDKMLDERTSCLVVQNPGFTGVIEDVRALAEKVHARGALLICVSDPFALALLKEPRALGADIVCGDTQAFGSPMSFGGPGCGFLAVPKESLRQLPGRIAGRTTDREGRTGYCLTLQTREQHIRRERATSNICSNQSLNALATSVYLSLLGKEGLRRNALYAVNLTRYLARSLEKIPGVTFPFSGNFFNEIVWRIDDAAGVMEKLYKRKCVAGLELAGFYPELKDAVLSCCTEITTKEEIDEFAAALKAVTGKK